MILIFTNKRDTHPTRVIQKLSAGGVSVFRFNTECLLTDYRFKWWSGPEGTDFWLENIKNGLEVYGHEITAIWDRRAMLPHSLPMIHGSRAVNKYNRDEAHGFLSFLRYYLKDVFSIGSIVQDRPADSKMLQLAIASKLGMKTPDTCFANYKEAFAPICERHRNLSMKPINSDSLFVNGQEEYVFYSQKVHSKDVLAQPEESFSQTVCFVQNYVDKKYEVRVTLCCDDVIACKIDSQSQPDAGGKIDWRQGYENDMAHTIIQLPDGVRSFCLNFLKEMKLNFGCFDFIVTPDDEYVFLECNPNGQWMWIEMITGYDISEVIARHLIDGK